MVGSMLGAWYFDVCSDLLVRTFPEGLNALLLKTQDSKSVFVLILGPCFLLIRYLDHLGLGAATMPGKGRGQNGRT